MADFFVVRKSTAEFTSENITYAENQLLVCTDIRNGVETDTGYQKLGNGVTPWVSLPYVNTGGGGGGVSYDSYVASLTQTGTDAPVATVMENTIGSIIWSRDSGGVYLGTLMEAFPDTQTWTMLQELGWDGALGSSLLRTSDDIVTLTITGGDDMLTSNSPAMIEIRVYP